MHASYIAAAILANTITITNTLHKRDAPSSSYGAPSQGGGFGVGASAGDSYGAPGGSQGSDYDYGYDDYGFGDESTSVGDSYGAPIGGGGFGGIGGSGGRGGNGGN